MQKKIGLTVEEKAKALEALKEMSTKAGECLFDKACILFASLSSEELLRFSAGGTQFHRLARTLVCACDDQVMAQIAAECILPAIKQARRIRQNRYC